MVARTGDAVVIAVDSKITQAGPISPFVPRTPPIDGKRKLVDVGTNGACAIESFSGTVNLDVATDLREWLSRNPTANARDSILALLQVAGQNWNNHHYVPGHWAKGRQPGDEITELLCGDYVDGQLVIVRGQTVLGQDGMAISKPMPPDGGTGDLLYVDGAISTKDFSFAVGPEIEVEWPTDERKVFHAVREAVRHSPQALAAFNAWELALASINPSAARPPRALLTSEIRRTQWNTVKAHALFKTIFRAVEENTELVAPPNNVRIIRRSGRSEATVESLWAQTHPNKRVGQAEFGGHSYSAHNSGELFRTFPTRGSSGAWAAHSYSLLSKSKKRRRHSRIAGTM